MIWFWNFVFYSWLGFLLEVTYASLTGAHPDRKCLLVLPLCPVYGLGAFAIVLLSRLIPPSPVFLFLLGCGAATAVEYLTALFYEKVLRVSFWNYQGLPGCIQGRVCLPFSLAWGLLSLPPVWWVYPAMAPWLERIPAPVSWAAAVTVGCDSLLSAILLRRTGDTRCLRWYAARA